MRRGWWVPAISIVLVVVLVMGAPLRSASAAVAVLAPPVGTTIVHSTVAAAGAVALLLFLAGAVAYKAYSLGKAVYLHWRAAETYYDSLPASRRAYWESAAQTVLSSTGTATLELDSTATAEVQVLVNIALAPVLDTIGKDGVVRHCINDTWDPDIFECDFEYPSKESVEKTHIARVEMTPFGQPGKWAYLILAAVSTAFGATFFLVPEDASFPIRTGDILDRGFPWPSGVVVVEGYYDRWERTWLDPEECQVHELVTWLNPPWRGAHFTAAVGCSEWGNVRWERVLKTHFPNLWKRIVEELTRRGGGVQTSDTSGVTWPSVEVTGPATVTVPRDFVQVGPGPGAVQTRWDEEDLRDRWQGPVTVIEEKVIIQTEVQPEPGTGVDLGPVIDAITQVRDAVNTARDTVADAVRRVGDSIERFFEPGPINWQPLQVEASKITTKFPFSLPWDVRHMVAQLDVEPRAPEFTYRQRFGGRDYEVQVDLEQFSGLFAGIRWAELAMIVGGSIIGVRRWMGGAV